MPLAIITGANRGLGLALAESYLNDGWKVIALVRSSSEALDSLAGSHACHVLLANLTDDDSLRSAIARIEDDKIDLLINCAGTMGKQHVPETGIEYQALGTFDRGEWLDVFNINVCTPQAVTELLMDRLVAAGGKVVTISSMLGSNAMNTSGNIYAYRASKAAVNSIMKSQGVNLGERGVTAVAMHPGWVRTDMGGEHADLSVEESVAGMRKVIDGLAPEDAGKFLAWDGRELPY